MAHDGAEKFREVKVAEGLFDDEVIYVSAQGSRIGIDGGRIVVTTADKQEAMSSFPVEKVRTVNVFGNVSVSTPFLASCGKAGMSVNYFHRRQVNFESWLSSTLFLTITHKNSTL